jgi:pyruvate/2-oxoglutarate dehydrogenase complex dihydrolipoamide dehydrogenase (E3) component
VVRDFDAIIIGAGQAGPSLAGRLTDAGMTVAFVERKLFGGTCVNTGCMPTKTLIASGYAAHLARRGADYGVMLDAPVRIDMARGGLMRLGHHEADHATGRQTQRIP